MEIKKLAKDDILMALDLVLNVFMEYEVPDYSQQGIETFQKCIKDDQWLKSLEIFGAYMNNSLVGVIATRNNGNHIALFFVKGNYHRQGIGRRLFDRVIENCTNNTITVNSSPYAIKIYRHLGFVETQTEQLTDGIRYTPMSFTKI
ncbi:GNAT family N-acetyltransferase [Sporanaerobium hydrogeniformans]|uniref:GNAT family N-acetyltransferase n=1 Tax=Sporanaerobium hydrogeniformans TaxID=3072179 RepID=A0AC61DD41_9FIRM|nr:GNAT family N-acetyltransferase [Sporanaerobium hydrogeniformans]PHV70705.1 GNAT family N-acetyltransferase [Sporanaerobium hydrogeniformans]